MAFMAFMSALHELLHEHYAGWNKVAPRLPTIWADGRDDKNKMLSKLKGYASLPTEIGKHCEGNAAQRPTKMG